MKKNKGMGSVGLVLSGGGTHGYAHIGVLKVLDEFGIKPKYVVGSSAGALMGVMICAGKSAKDIEKYLFDKRPYSFLDPVFSRAGLFKGEKLTEMVLNYSGVRLFNQLKIPLIMNATNINTGEEKVFAKGLLAPAINASIAFPGVFVPRKIGEEYFVDGGTYNPAPLHLAPYADTIIIVDVSYTFNNISSESTAIQVLEQSVLLMQRRLVSWDMKINSEGKNIILLKPKVEKFQFFELKSSSLKKMVDEGESEARKVLDKLI